MVNCIWITRVSKHNLKGSEKKKLNMIVRELNLIVLVFGILHH